MRTAGGTWGTDGEERELRLALAMRGGVSLAVWIGGACAEIDELRRARSSSVAPEDRDPFWSDLTRACGYSRVSVDVLSGASAGGLNGVLFAAAIRHGFALRDLEPVWRELASLDDLRRTSEPWHSILDGDEAFLEAVHDKLASLVGDAPGGDPDQPVDLRLSATHVEPVAVATVSPTDERLVRFRSDAGFHFRHDPTGAAPRLDLEDDAAALWRLAVAARATASFPVAFEAAVVRSSRPGSFSDAPPAAAPGRMVDCRGVFSDSAGSPRLRGPEPHPLDFAVADGGIIDNIPIGRALDAVAAAPADGPTRRVVAYLHPTGPPPPAAEATATASAGVASASVPGQPARGARAAVAGVVRAKVANESIDADLAQLEGFNASIRLGLLLRRATVERLPVVAGDGGAVVRPTASQWDAYVVQRSAADAARLRALLDDPVAVLGEDPFPHDPAGDDVWRAPLARWPRWDRERLEVALSTVFADALAATPGVDRPSGAVLRVGLSTLRRSIDLALEWCRHLPAADDAAATAIGVAKRRLYDLRSSVGVLERARRLGWVTLAGHAGPPDGSVDAWAAAAVGAVDGLLWVPAEAAEALARKDPSAAGYLVEVEARLDRLAEEGFAVGSPPPEHVDARLPIAIELDRLIDQLLELAPAYGPAESSETVPGGLFPDDHPGALADRVLRWGWGPVGARLVVLEILSLAEHLAGSTPTVPVDFYRISAAAPTPLAEQFTALRERSEAIGAAEPDGWTGLADFLRPEVKLAGNELSNFAAFLDPRWRTNDWLWGRLDATSSLVRLLVDSARLVAEDGTATLPAPLCELAGLDADARADEVVRALTLRRQDQVATECGVAPDARAGYTVGIEDLTHPGNRKIRGALVRSVGAAAKVLRTELPGRWRHAARPIGWIGRIVVWFRFRPRGGLPHPPRARSAEPSDR